MGFTGAGIIGRMVVLMGREALFITAGGCALILIRWREERTFPIGTLAAKDQVSGLC